VSDVFAQAFVIFILTMFCFSVITTVYNTSVRYILYISHSSCLFLYWILVEFWRNRKSFGLLEYEYVACRPLTGRWELIVSLCEHICILT